MKTGKVKVTNLISKKEQIVIGGEKLTIGMPEKKEIPVVVTTQAPNGNSNMQVNEPGQLLIKNKLAIPAYDMSIESQTVKLAWLLAKKSKGEIDYKGVCQAMVTDIRGEINVMKELIQ